MSIEEALQQIHERATRDRVIPPDLGFADVLTLFQMFTAHLEAHRHYAGTPYDGHVILIRAEEEIVPGREEALGWCELAPGGVEVHVNPGDHFSMMRPPHVGELARRLRQILDRAAPGAVLPGGDGESRETS
jgi:thioesterase domain-containing protein